MDSTGSLVDPVDLVSDLEVDEPAGEIVRANYEWRTHGTNTELAGADAHLLERLSDELHGIWFSYPTAHREHGSADVTG